MVDLNLAVLLAKQKDSSFEEFFQRVEAVYLKNMSRHVEEYITLLNNLGIICF